MSTVKESYKRLNITHAYISETRLNVATNKLFESLFDKGKLKIMKKFSIWHTLFHRGLTTIFDLNIQLFSLNSVAIKEFHDNCSQYF